MGVHGLWDLIRPVATKTSLAALGRDAFLANRHGLRAFVIGIDASIWIFHAQATDAGSNPFMRTLFYKISQLLQHPVLPVFVFDGPNKPTVKRNQHVKGRFGTNDPHSVRFKWLLDACGLEWWNAPGEAEAELALMSRQGKIDAVLSDDVDALLFGATCLLRNNSPTLSGATGGNAGRTELRYYDMFRSSDICDAWAKEGSCLKTEEDCRNAMVLIALLSGGDYVPEGIGGLGPSIAIGLAHAGVSNFLKIYTKDKSAFDSKLGNIKRFMVNELQSNDTGFIGRKYGKLAQKVEKMSPTDIFNGSSLEAYLRPVRSPDDPHLGWPGFGKGEASDQRGMGRYGGRWDLESCARACEQYFEWGTVDAVCKKFSNENGLFCSEVMNEARQRVLVADKRKGRRKSSLSRLSLGGESPARITAFFSNQEFRRASLPVIDNSVPDHLVKVTSIRPSPMCDGMTELRLSFKVESYVGRCKEVMTGDRVDPSELDPERRAALGLVEGSRPAVADTTIRHEIRTWIPDYLIRAAWPSLAEEYDAIVASKAAAKATPKKKRAPKKATKKDTAVTTENAAAFVGYFSHHAPPAASSSSSRTETVSSLSDSLESLSVRTPSPSPTPVRRRKKNTTPLFDPAPDSPLSSPTPINRVSSRSSRRVAAAESEATPRSRSTRSKSRTADLCQVLSSPLPKARSTRKSKSISPPSAVETTVIVTACLDAISPPPAGEPLEAITRTSATPPAASPILPPASGSAIAPRKRTPPQPAALQLVEHDKRSRSDVSSSALSRCTTPTQSISRRTAGPSPKKSKTKTPPAPFTTGTAVEPIDLCDSDDEPTPPPRRGRPRKSPSPDIVCLSTPPNVSKPQKVSKAMPKSTSTKSASTPKLKPKTTTTRITPTSPPLSTAAANAVVQSTLESLVIGRPRRKPAKPVPETPKTPPRPKYTIEIDANGEEHIYIVRKP